MAANTIDPHLLALLAQVAQVEAAHAGSPLPDAERRRAISEDGAALARAPRRRDVETSDHYAGAPGREIPMRLYTPRRSDGQPGRLMAYFHGGGWMVGSIATHDSLCAALAAYSGYTVASVHYRRTPENAFPALHDDAWEALAWLGRHAGRWQAQGQPIAVGGDSAGAHLALGCAVRAARNGLGEIPPIDRMLLFYPPMEPHAQTESRRLFAQGPSLTAASMANYWQVLRGDLPDADDNVLLYPGRWPALQRLPPTVMFTASHDLLRDEGEAYAERLRAAGVRVELVRAAGMVHGFARMLHASPAARAHVRRAGEALRRIA